MRRVNKGKVIKMIGGGIFEGVESLFVVSISDIEFGDFPKTYAIPPRGFRKGFLNMIHYHIIKGG